MRKRPERTNQIGRRVLKTRRRRTRRAARALPDALAGKSRLTEPLEESTLSGVRRAILRLPVRFRDFLELDLVEGLSLEEICDQLDLQPVSCKTLKRLAFDALRRALLENLPD